ncbi:transcriptional regulator [Enterococcus cecorum]|nr:transcriptional regulator [Enterococcus cecorum]
MKVLIEAGVVTARKEGKWQYYSLVTENIEEFQELIHQILNIKLDLSQYLGHDL